MKSASRKRDIFLNTYLFRNSEKYEVLKPGCNILNCLNNKKKFLPVFSVLLMNYSQVFINFEIMRTRFNEQHAWNKRLLKSIITDCGNRYGVEKWLSPEKRKSAKRVGIWKV